MNIQTFQTRNMRRAVFGLMTLVGIAFLLITPRIVLGQIDREPGNLAVTVDLVNHFGGSTQAVFIQGHYAYVGFGSELEPIRITPE